MRKMLALLLILVFSLFFAPSNPTEVYSGDSIKQFDRQIEELNKKLEDLKKNIERSNSQMNHMAEEKELLQRELSDLEHGISLVGNELAVLKAEEELSSARYARLYEESALLQNSIEEKEKRSNQIIITLYKNYMLNYTALILSSASINEIIENSIFLQYLYEADKNYFRFLKKEKEKYRETQIQQVILQEELYLAKSQKEHKENELLSLEKQKGNEVLKLTMQQQRTAAETQAFEREYDATEQQIQEINRRKAEELRRRQAFDSPMGPVIWPTAGRVVSGFGMRRHPIFGVDRMHTGIDIDAPAGTTVVAVADGWVIYAGWLGGYGNTVMIQHDNQHSTLYAHLRSFAVNEDQKVSQGELIGYVGSTGWSTGPHLHFEVRVNNESVNPMNYLPR